MLAVASVDLQSRLGPLLVNIVFLLDGNAKPHRAGAIHLTVAGSGAVHEEQPEHIVRAAKRF